ncbi:MAG: response regulator transcription factor [Calditrichia bacterium]|nr:response regulator transcription factor [Calditrichia bacterium]
MKIKCLLVEDEKPSMQRLTQLISEIDNLSIVGFAEDGIEAVEQINSLKPDLVFLDINLPEFSGIEVLNKITHYPYIIFITAYDEYAIKAFEKNAVDYLLKPISLERLQKAILRLEERRPKLDAGLLKIVENLQKKKKYIRKFSLKLKDEILIMDEDDISYFKAEDKYVFLCTHNKEYFYDYPLKVLEEKLDPEKFIRIHKSYIVAIDKIKKLHKMFNGRYNVQISNIKDNTLPVSKSYLAGLKEILNM